MQLGLVGKGILAMVGILVIVLLLMFVTATRQQAQVTESMAVITRSALEEISTRQADAKKEENRFKAQQLAKLLAQTAPELILSFNLSSLLEFAANVQEDKDIVYVSFRNMDGNELAAAGDKSSVPPEQMLEVPIVQDSVKLGKVFLGYTQKRIEDQLAQDRKKGDEQLKLLQQTREEAQNKAGRNLTLISVGALFGALLLALLLGRSIKVPLAALVEYARKVAAGDLLAKPEGKFSNELGQLRGMIETMVGSLRSKIEEADQSCKSAAVEAERAKKAQEEAQEAHRAAEGAKREGIMQAVGKLEQVVEIITSASAGLSNQIGESSRGAENQANRIAETATALEEMNATVLEVAKNSSGAAETTDDARKKASEGATVVGQVVKGISDVQAQALGMKDDMGALGKLAEGIGQIMNVITDIADQTNLLALNAAIEAARAGDAGRGFAVVADEVRKLAEKTMAATKEVGDAIAGIQNSARVNIGNVDRAVKTIEEATALAGQAGEALGEIVSLVQMASDQVRSIATAAEEQSATSMEIGKSIEQVNTISLGTVRAMGEGAKAVTELVGQSQALKNLIEELERQEG